MLVTGIGALRVAARYSVHRAVRDARSAVVDLGSPDGVASAQAPARVADHPDTDHAERAVQDDPAVERVPHELPMHLVQRVAAADHVRTQGVPLVGSEHVGQVPDVHQTVLAQHLAGVRHRVARQTQVEPHRPHIVIRAAVVDEAKQPVPVRGCVRDPREGGPQERGERQHGERSARPESRRRLSAAGHGGTP